MEHKKIEEAYNDTFSGLTMYYRDCDLNPDFISKYNSNQIIQERGFTDVSSFAEGLTTNMRYAIASNKAVNMGQVNPDVAKYGFHLISAPSYYKVLDVYKIGSQTQVLLLHFNEKYMSMFTATTSNIEEKVVGMGRDSFDKKIQMNPNTVLNENEWRARTQFPIGMSDTGKFFLAATDTTRGEEKPKNEPNIPKTPTNDITTKKSSNPTEEKKSFWKRLFG